MLDSDTKKYDFCMDRNIKIRRQMNLINTLKEWKIQILNVQHLQILGFHLLIQTFLQLFVPKTERFVPIEILAEEIGTHSKKATEEIIRSSKEKV